MFADPEQRKLLALMLGAGLLGNRGQFGPGISQGLLGAMQAQQQNKQMKMREGEEAQQREMRAMQMEQMRRAQAEQEQERALAGRAFGPNPNMVRGDDEGNPMPQAPGGGGMQEFAQGMMAINPARGMQFMPKPKSPVALVEGGRLVDPETGREIAANPKRSGPQVGAIREVKSGGNVLTYEWSGEKWEKIASAPQFKPDGPEKPDKPPQGYRYTPDRNGLEPIPGGPADAKVGREADALRNRQEGALARADMVLGNVSQAIKDTGFTTAGPVGAVMKKIPGTGARDLDRKLDAVRANIGFAELQAMREASPTGGALGQVAVQELNMLQSVLGSLDTSQSPDQLLKNLYAIEKHYNNWKQAVKQSKQPPKSQSGGWSVERVH